MVALDIHNFEKQYQQAQAHFMRSALSDHNKELVLRFRDACLLQQVCGKVRLIRTFYVLEHCGTLLAKEFDKATKEDLQRLVTTLMNEHLAPATMATYKAILKRFMSFVFAPDEFPKPAILPACIAWITTHIRKRDERRLQRIELLEPKDIEALLAVCHNPRDKALISVLWETGGRIAEIGNLQLKHVTKTVHGYLLDMNGKTGHRTLLVVSSAPLLTQWLNNHPFKNNPESPLWVHYQYTTTPRLAQYSTIRALLRRHFQRAGITKPFHPHIFRHSRATFLLAQGLMNEAQAKSYFGWTPDSGMLGTYSHLVDQDANNAILRENNLTPERLHQDALKPILCRICNEMNAAGADYCTKCNAVLNLKKAYEHQQVHDLHDDVTMTLFKILMDKGLIDEAAKAVHEAGLGAALKRLAEHPQAKRARTNDDLPPTAAPTAPSPPGPDDETAPAQAIPPA
jgi:integrase/recombinase XerD